MYYLYDILLEFTNAKVIFLIMFIPCLKINAMNVKEVLIAA